MGQIGIRWLAFAGAFLLVAVMLTGHAVAEEAESVSRFIELMDDPAVRAFLDQAAQGATPGPTPGAADEARLVAEGAGAALSHCIARWTAGAVALPAEMDIIGRRLSQSIGGFHGRVAGFVVMFCLAGYIAERLFWRVSRSIRLRIVNAPQVTAGDRVMFFVARVIVTLISMSMVALGSIGAFFAVSWPEAVRPLLMPYLWVFLTGGFAAMLARFIVAPWFKAIRMVPMGPPVGVDNLPLVDRHSRGRRLRFHECRLGAGTWRLGSQRCTDQQRRHGIGGISVCRLRLALVERKRCRSGNRRAAFDRRRA